MWPDTSAYKDHIHLTDPGLKRKYTQGYQGRKGGAKMRTNPARAKGITLRPRRRAYGPW